LRPRGRSLVPCAHLAAGLLHGTDLNPNGIAFCQKRHDLPGLDFVHGNAEDLPFDDQSFDAVLNVEASHLLFRVSALPCGGRARAASGRAFPFTRITAPVSILPIESRRMPKPRCGGLRNGPSTTVIRRLESTQHNTQRLLGPVSRRAPAFVRGLAVLTTEVGDGVAW
jgi:Methyltransferase domain